MKEGTANELAAVIILLYIYKMRTLLKHLHGDLDPPIKKSNMEIGKIQRRAVGKLKL